jgi:hypothetical protein
LENLRKPLATNRSSEIGATLVILHALQQKINSQVGVVKAFKGLLEGGCNEYNLVLEKSTTINKV